MKTVTTERRQRYGTIFDRHDFNRLPSAINWRRRGELDGLSTPDFIDRVKSEAMRCLNERI